MTFFIYILIGLIASVGFKKIAIGIVILGLMIIHTWIAGEFNKKNEWYLKHQEYC